MDCVVTALHSPGTPAVVEALRSGLARRFRDVDVAAVPCPDLSVVRGAARAEAGGGRAAAAGSDSADVDERKEDAWPWGMACRGLGAADGDAVVVDIGTASELLDPKCQSREYSMHKVLHRAGVAGNGFVLGAGAAVPKFTGGVVGEAMPNAWVAADGERNLSTFSTVTGAGERVQAPYEHMDFGVLQNLLATSGRGGEEVIRVRVQGRKTDTNFPDSVKEAVEAAFPGKHMAVGGVFRLSGAPMDIHIMDSLPCVLQEDVSEFIKSLKRFVTPAEALTCLTTIVTGTGEASLRPKNNPHTHCFGTDATVGGHYHFDTAAETATYEAYFVVAKTHVQVSTSEDASA